MVRADPSRDYYGDLELPPTADINDIKKQFKKLALKYHPDRNIGRESEVNAKFQAIQSAHEVLTDSEQRAKYDASRKRGTAYGSGFGASMPTPRGNPYSNAGSQWAPPPKRNPNPNRAPPPSAGAQRYKNFETPGAGASAHKTAQEGAESRRSTYQAWENMRGKPESAKTAYGSRAETGPGKSWATPKAPPKEHTPQSGREESNNMKHSVPPRSKAYEEFMTGSMPRRSQSTKRAGFMPSDPTGDEPQAGSKSAYFTSSNRRAEFPSDIPPPPPRSHVVDPLKQFREQAGASSEPRLSTPYATQGGEKTNPFERANINRSRSTREPGSAGAFSPTDRHRSASPPRSRPHRSYPTTDYVPRTDSDPNIARRNNPYAPRHTPVVDLDSTSSEDEARGPAASHQKPREYAMPKKRTTATAKPPPTGTENSKHIPLREFREWWKANQKSHMATDPSLKDFPQGQKTNSANGQPSMYAYPFTVNAHQIKPAVMLPKVSEVYASKDGYLTRDEGPYGLTSRSFSTKWPVPSKDGTDHLGRSDTTTPSGASTHALNSFEIKQRNLLDQLVNNPRKGERLCSFTSKRSFSGMASQPAPPQASLNSQHSFSFDTDGTFEKPPMTSFPSSSTENISTKFSPEDWDGKFKAGDYFMNEQKAANMPTPGRARSGSRTRGKSPVKPRAGSRPNLSTKVSVPGLDPKPDSEVPPESPGGTKQFSAQEWEQTFAPAVFAPPPHQSPNGRSAYPNRKPSKILRGSVPRPTAGTAAVIDDSDSSDGKPLFMGRNKFNGNSSSSETNTRPETRTASPTPMDIDTEEPPRTPSAPRMASSTLRKQGLAAFAKAAAEGQTGQPRNVPLEPSRPEWRDTNGRAEASNAPQPDLPPRVTKSPSKRRAAESAGSDGFESINLETLKNAEPIMQGAKGLNGFDDLASNLPFQSQAASKVPIAKLSTTGNLDLPIIPRAPNPVNASQPASWQAYLSAFNTYMVDWDLFYCRVISHFTARRLQVQQMRQGWLGGVGDEPCLQYMEGLAEDMKVHDWWGTAMEMHKQNLKTFMAMREAAKHHFGVA